MRNCNFPLIFTFLVSLSCGSRDNNQSESFSEIKGSNESNEKIEAVPILIMTYPVESFSTWKSAFEEDKSNRESLNIVDLGDLVSFEDSRMVSVFLKTPSHKKGEEFAKSDAMQKSLKLMGVIGDANIILIDALQLPERPVPQRYRMMITHEIEEYNHWKKIFDQHEPERRDAGLELIGLGRSIINAKIISVMSAFDDMDAAQIFAASDELRNAMKESGVISDPILAWYENPRAN